MGFVDAIQSGFRNCFRYSGRASRSEFWYFALFLLSGNIATAVLGLGLLSVTSAGVWIALAFFYFVLFVPLFAVGVRRMHDIDVRGWWLIGLFPTCYLGSGGPIPFEFFGEMIDTVGIVMLLYFILILFCLAWPGTKDTNRFGPPVISALVPE